MEEKCSNCGSTDFAIIRDTTSSRKCKCGHTWPFPKNLETRPEKYSELEIKYHQAMGALGYPVPGDIPEGNLRCGLCEAKTLQIIKLHTENKLLRELIEKALV